MRVMHVHRIRGIGGSERHLLTLLPALAERGIDPILVGLDDPAWDAADFYGALQVPAVRIVSPRVFDPLLLVRLARTLRADIVHTVRLLDLPDDVLGMLERGQLTEGHARAVLAVPDHEGRRKLAREIVQKGLSVRAAEQRAKWAGAKQKPRVRATPVDPALAARVRDALQHLTGFHAKVGRGSVELAFGDEHELAELAEALERASLRL